MSDTGTMNPGAPRTESEADKVGLFNSVREIVATKDVSDSPFGPMIAGILVLVLFFGVFVGWSAYAPLSSAALAPGSLKIEGNRKSVQHLDGGIVDEIKVKDGDKVEAGQLLMTLDATRAKADYDLLSGQYDSMRAQEARLSAELKGKTTIEYPQDLLDRQREPQVAAAIKGQETLIAARAGAFESELEALRKGISELQAQIDGAKAQIKSKAAQRQSMESELAGLQKLLDQGIISRTRLLTEERDVSRLEGEEHELETEVARYQQSIEQSKVKIEESRQQLLSQVVNELRQTQGQVADIHQRMLSAKDVLDRTDIRAPVAGTVFNLQIFTKGAVIGRGETIMEIEPVDQQMRVEGQLRVDQVDRVHVGMDAQIQFSGTSIRNMPVITGKVTYLSPDRQIEAHSGTPYYTVDAKIDEASLEKTKKLLTLYPGMPATIIVATGNRTALDYMLKPLLVRFDSAFREE